MILKNYKRFLNFYSVGGIQWTTNNAGVLTASKMLDLNGNAINAQTAAYVSSQQAATNLCNAYMTKTNLFLRFGTGSAQPTADDYKLDTDVTSSLSNVQYTRTIQDSEDGTSVTVTINVTGFNNTNSDIIIREYGIVKHIAQRGFGDSNFNSNYKETLFSRDVLDQPITLEAGKGFALTVTWTEQ